MKKLFIFALLGFCLCDNPASIPYSPIEPYTAYGGLVALSSGDTYECYQYAYIDNRGVGTAALGTQWTVTGSESDIARYIDLASVDWDTCYCIKQEAK